MQLREKSVQFIRRLSVFYLLLIVLMVCFGLYYFYYVPQNRNGLNQQGQKFMIQLATNFAQKSADIKDIFDSASSVEQLRSKTGNFKYVNANIPYRLDSVYQPGEKDFYAGLIPFIDKDKTGQWCIQYSSRFLRNDSVILIKMDDFIKPLIEGRNDIFDTYMLFSTEGKSLPTQPINLNILYRDEGLSTSATVNADTLFRLEKNSDFSGIAQLSVSGTDYEVFLRPFDFYGKSIYLAGLISKDNYNRNVQSTPLNFIPYSIVLILFIVVSLPFLKIYLLSAMESIKAGDVLRVALSFFAGSSVLVLILFYIFINLFTKITFNHRLDRFGSKLHADIENEFTMAGKQLSVYDSIYQSLDLTKKELLAYKKQVSPQAKDSINAQLIPVYYKNISRLFWIDSAGNTLAKWNPFNFNAPLTSVKNFDFFKIFTARVPVDSSAVNGDQNIIYTGKSNTTGEFQVYIAKPMRRPVSDTSGQPLNSVGIVLATFLNSSIKPVIPAGFGFCLIDREGRILMDADAHRNLTENLLKETGNDVRIAHNIQYKNDGIIDKVQLYGQPCELKVIPIEGQPLYVVVYYNKRLLANNILRLLNFSLETMIYLFLGLGICISLSSANVLFTNSRLRFRLDKVEWMRYSIDNKNGYAFTRVYYKYLAALTFVLFLAILIWRLDMRTLFYMSLVLPFYAIGALIISRTQWTAPGLIHLKEYYKSIEVNPMKLSGLFAVLCIALINGICFPFFKKDFDFQSNSVIPFFGFQLLAILGLFQTRRFIRKNENKKKQISNHHFCRRNYIESLCFAIALVGVLPTIGVLTYGFYCEKIQYKKDKLYKIAENSEARCMYLANKVIPVYKPVVHARFATDHFFDSLLFRSGVYLTERDSVLFTDSNSTAGDIDTGRLYDNPYCYFMNNYYITGSRGYYYYSVSRRALDNTWQFYMTRDDSLDWLKLYYNNKIAAQKGYRFVVRSSMQNPLRDLIHLPLYVVLATLLSVFSLGGMFVWLIRGTVFKLFLFSFTRDIQSDGSADPLNKCLQDPGSQPDEPESYLDFMDQVALESSAESPIYERELLILGNERRYEALYDCVWDSLLVEEQYVLFDFSLDGYTNYKNSKLLNELIDKGLLQMKEDALQLFSLSFRNYVLSKKDNAALNTFMAERSSMGFWTSLRIPILTIVAMVAIFMAITQNDFTNKLTAFLTSLLALFPLVLKFVESFRVNTDDKKK